MAATKSIFDNKLLPLVIFIFLLLFISCGTQLYIPSSAHAQWLSSSEMETSIAGLEEGRALYINHCSSCHYLHYPNQLTIAEWDSIFPGMSEQVLIPDSSKLKIYYYLLAGSKDTGAQEL